MLRIAFDQVNLIKGATLQGVGRRSGIAIRSFFCAPEGNLQSIEGLAQRAVRAASPQARYTTRRDTILRGSDLKPQSS